MADTELGGKVSLTRTSAVVRVDTLGVRLGQRPTATRGVVGPPFLCLGESRLGVSLAPSVDTLGTAECFEVIDRVVMPVMVNVVDVVALGDRARRRVSTDIVYN